MSNIFIKKLEIQNLKCFNQKTNGHEINFQTPDGKTEGSGLNFLIGENGNGKTTILEAINYLTLNKYSTENSLSIHDFNSTQEPIHVLAETHNFNCKMPLPYRDKYFECNGFEFIAKSRTNPTPGKLLSSPFQISTCFRNINKNYKTSEHKDSGKPISDVFKIYKNDVIIDDEINIFYFDKNRTRQITPGSYKTTFEKVCDDLNWKFVKNLNECDESERAKLLNNIRGEYFKDVTNLAQAGIGSKLTKQLEEFFKQKDYSDLSIELLDTLHPFSNAFFAICSNDNLKQINTKKLGSGIEIILTLLMLKSIAETSKGSIIYLIDEPELHLHPKAQEKLLDILFEESKSKQIIISTHSPYMFKNKKITHAGLLLLSRDKNNNVQITNAKEKSWGLFSWSPSWGEINYSAFNMATEEFHNELYGYLQQKTGNTTISSIENFFQNKKYKRTKKWIEVKNGKQLPAKDVTLSTYIRHTIHHPENNCNVTYTKQELRNSIKTMIILINNINQNKKP